MLFAYAEQAQNDRERNENVIAEATTNKKSQKTAKVTKITKTSDASKSARKQ